MVLKQINLYKLDDMMENGFELIMFEPIRTPDLVYYVGLVKDDIFYRRCVNLSDSSSKCYYYYSGKAFNGLRRIKKSNSVFDTINTDALKCAIGYGLRNECKFMLCITYVIYKIKSLYPGEKFRDSVFYNKEIYKYVSNTPNLDNFYVTPLDSTITFLDAKMILRSKCITDDLEIKVGKVFSQFNHFFTSFDFSDEKGGSTNRYFFLVDKKVRILESDNFFEDKNCGNRRIKIMKNYLTLPIDMIFHFDQSIGFAYNSEYRTLRDGDPVTKLVSLFQNRIDKAFGWSMDFGNGEILYIDREDEFDNRILSGIIIRVPVIIKNRNFEEIIELIRSKRIELDSYVNDVLLKKAEKRLSKKQEFKFEKCSLIKMDKVIEYEFSVVRKDCKSN